MPSDDVLQHRFFKTRFLQKLRRSPNLFWRQGLFLSCIKIEPPFCPNVSRFSGRDGPAPPPSHSTFHQASAD